jgi:hypothetical protein
LEDSKALACEAIAESGELAALNLYELAFASCLYDKVTNFDAPYQELRGAVGTNLDMTNDEHGHALFKWLNGWGCRLPKLKEDNIVRAFQTWASQYSDCLPDKSLLDFTANDYSPVGAAFDALSMYSLGRRRFGPTAASKVLFAIRPESYIPWDSAIRAGLKFGMNGVDYVRFLKKVHQDLEDIEKQCKVQHLNLDGLSAKLGRPSATPVQLVDEYYWLTLTRRCEIPRAAELAEWISWVGED